MRGTIRNDYNCLIINDLHPWNNLGLKNGSENRVTELRRTPQPRNYLITWRCKASAKGGRGYGKPERQAVGCDPEKIFSQIFQNVNIHKISDLHKITSKQ